MRWIRRTAAVLLTLMLLWLGLALSGWLPPIPEANREALRVVRAQGQWPDPAGNAFHAVWFRGYGVDAGERARLRALPPDQMVAELAARTPAPRAIADLPGQCHWRQARGCVPALRAAAPEPDARALVSLRALYRYDHYRDLQTPAIDMALPPLGQANAAVLVEAIARFDAGAQESALALLCEDAAFWRRLRANTNALVVDMLGTALLTTDATVFAELLAELSPEASVPAACASAFAPLQDAELVQCEVFRAEFALGERFDPDIAAELAGDGRPSAWERMLTRPLYDREHMLGQMAPAYAAFCSAAHGERVAARARFPPGTPAVDRCNGLEWAFNAVGCILADIGGPHWAEFYDRVLDLDSRLKLVSSALWLREQPAGQPLPLLFDTRPLPLREPGAELVQRDAGALLRVPLRHPRAGIDHYEIPARVP